MLVNETNVRNQYSFPIRCAHIFVHNTMRITLLVTAIVLCLFVPLMRFLEKDRYTVIIRRPRSKMRTRKLQ